jgi:hypothetical protein
VKERDELCSKILGAGLHYRHLLDGSIFNLGFVYEEGEDILRKANISGLLTNLGILSQQGWRSGMLLVHFIMSIQKQVSNTRTTESSDQQALFIDLLCAMKLYGGPDIGFAFYKPTVNHSTNFLFILNGKLDKEYTSATNWPTIKKCI